jgi:integrase
VTEYAALFRLLRDAGGEDRPVRSIGREDCRRIRDLVSVLPAHAAKRWPGKSLVEVAELARDKGLTPMDPATANAYLGRLSTLMRWAEREEYIARNPAVGLTVAAPETDAREARLPFSIDQLNAIFRTPPCDGSGERNSRFWVPLLALFAGLRLNEACALRVEDVARRDDIDVIVLRPDSNGGRLKTKAARRIVPVHPELARIGFVAFAAGQRRAGHVRLFPELKEDSRGRYSDPFQKWFSRHL